MGEFLGSAQNTLITATVGGKATILGTVQQFAYQVQRQKAPIYVIGSTSPITIAKGARQVAGTMQGVVLSYDFAMQLIKIIWNQVTANSGFIYRINGVADIQAEFGDYSTFITKFAMPLFKYSENTAYKDSNEATITNLFKSATKYSLPDGQVTDQKQTLDSTADLKIPPMYLDEIPPIELKLVTPLSADKSSDNTKTIITYEEITLSGVEFLSNDLAIQAGREQIFESVNFIQRGVIKNIQQAEGK